MDRNLAKAVTEKKPVPEIDFSLHTMEDGTQVSTMERVVKGGIVQAQSPSVEPSLIWGQRCKRPR